MIVPQCLVYPPSLAVPEECIKVEDVATLVFRGDGPYIAQLLEGNSAMLQEAESPPTFSKKSETMFTPSCTLKSIL